MKNVILIAVFLCLGACSSGGDWPTLSEPIPGPDARERAENAPEPMAKPNGHNRPEQTPGQNPGMVRESMPPVAPTMETDILPLTAEDALSQLDGIKETLRQETLAYREAVAKIAPLTGDERLDAWYDAQAALTRLSQTASRLDILRESESDMLADARTAANTEGGILETFIVGERQRLKTLKPE